MSVASKAASLARQIPRQQATSSFRATVAATRNASDACTILPLLLQAPTSC